MTFFDKYIKPVFEGTIKWPYEGTSLTKKELARRQIKSRKKSINKIQKEIDFLRKYR
tara:strand:+ start:339 stop:509 length:171 start_codon:yes stop_codon:yes gene_type:complete